MGCVDLPSSVLESTKPDVDGGRCFQERCKRTARVSVLRIVRRVVEVGFARKLKQRKAERRLGLPVNVEIQDAVRPVPGLCEEAFH